MEFDSNLCRLQSELNSLEKRNLLNRTDADGVVASLSEMFLDKDDTSRARLNFFLLLNTDIKASELLANDIDVGLFVNTAPRMTKKFYLFLVYELDLQKEFCDIIIHCPSPIVSELLDVFVSEMHSAKFHKEKYGDSVLSKVAEAIYFKIFKTYKKGNSNKSVTALVKQYEEIMKLIITVIKTSVQMGLLEINQFTSNQFLNFFNLLHNSLKAEKEVEVFEDNDVYKIESCLIANDPEESLNNACDKSQGILFNSCQQILDIITLDMWLDWSECLVNGSKSMQSTIGEKIFSICEIVEKDKIKVSDNMSNCLNCFKIKPESESDKISKSSIKQIVENIKSTKKPSWFKALIHSEEVFENDDWITSMLDHLDLSDSEDIQFLLERSLKGLKKQCQVEKNKIVFMLSFKKLSLEDQILMLETLFTSGDYVIFESLQHENELIEMFNKISASSEKDSLDSELLLLCLQSPLRTICKICQQGITNRKDMKKYVDILMKLKVVSSTVIQQENDKSGESTSMLSWALCSLMDSEDLTNKEKNTLISFIICLDKLLEPDFLEKCMLDAIFKDMEQKNWNRVAFRMEILRGGVRGNAFTYERNILLAFLCQILGQLSWDATSFVLQKADLREITINVIFLLLRRMEDDEEGLSLEWLRIQVLKQSKVNQVYFSDLWFRFDKQFRCDELHLHFLMLLTTKCKFEEILDSISTKLSCFKCKQISQHLTATLVKLLPILTSKEWIPLFTHVKTIVSSNGQGTSDSTDDMTLLSLDYFITSLYIFGLQLSAEASIFPCFEYCIRNFGRLVQQIISARKSTLVESSLNLYKKLIFVLVEIQSPQFRRACCIILSAVLLELIDVIIDKAEGNVDFEHLKEWTNLLKVEEVEKAVENKLREFTQS